MERKCPQCKIWNASNNYCTKCNQPLDPQLIRELADNKREQENAKSEYTRGGHSLKFYGELAIIVIGGILIFKK